MIRAIAINPRSAAAFTLPAGSRLTVIDPCGEQVSDLVAYAAGDPSEMISNGRTFDYEETIRLTTGHRLWSNRSRPMLLIAQDSVGRHDFLLTPCNAATFQHFYPDRPVHRGCEGNLAEALAPFGINGAAIPTAFNLFMNVAVEPDSGRLQVRAPLSRAGDAVILVALIDLVIGLTACSAYASNAGSFKPIHYRIETPGAAGG